MGIGLEKVSAEADGAIEFNLPPTTALAACEDWLAFRALFKASAREFGWIGTWRSGRSAYPAGPPRRRG